MCDSVTTGMDLLAPERGDAGIDRTGVGWVYADVYESVDRFVTGSPDLEFGFRFGVLETGVGMDGASVSGSLCRLCFRVQYLAMGGGHIARRDGEASD